MTEAIDGFVARIPAAVDEAAAADSGHAPTAQERLLAAERVRRAIYEYEFPLVQELRADGMTWVDLAGITGVSEVTLERDFNKSRAW